MQSSSTDELWQICIDTNLSVLILASEKITDDNESFGLTTEMSEFNLSIPTTPLPTLESLGEMSGSKETAPQSETSLEVEENAHNSTFLVVKADGRKVSGGLIFITYMQSFSTAEP